MVSSDTTALSGSVAGRLFRTSVHPKCWIEFSRPPLVRGSGPWYRRV